MADRRSLLSRLAPSLLGRIALALAVVGLAPTIFAAYRLIDLNSEAMTRQVQQTHALATRSVAERIGELLASRITLATGLASNTALASPLSAEARALLAENLQAMAPLGVLGIAVVNPGAEKVILAQLSDEETRRRVQRTFDEPSDRAVAAYPGPDGLLLRVAVPLPGQFAELWLIVEGSALPAALRASELGEEAEMVLAERHGGAIVGSLAGFPEAMLEAARAGQLQRLKPTFRSSDDNEDFIGASSPVPVADADWVVLSRQPSRIAHAVARQMRGQAVLAIGLSALLVLLLSAAAYATFVRPMRRLAQAQRRLAGLGTGGGGGGDEIAELQASFEALERGLKDRDALGEVFLGRYQIVEVIGSGAMGTVFLGHDPKLQRPLALKTIRLDKEMTADKREDLLSRLLKEAVTVARFSHPNIVSVYDVEDRAEAAFIAMEFIDGVSLEHLLWKSGKLSFAQVIPLGAAIARGLAAAHEHGLVHHDVKPANILLGRDGSIKVTDFGIAELITSMATKSDVVFGTPGYLPPETLQGLGYDASGDLFSLGAVLYYALAGVRPFEGRTPKEVIRKTLFGTPRPARQLEPSVPEELDRLLLQLLARDRSDRPQDARGVAERFEEMEREMRLVWQPPVESMRSGEAAEGKREPTQFVPTVRLPSGGKTVVLGE